MCWVARLLARSVYKLFGKQRARSKPPKINEVREAACTAAVFGYLIVRLSIYVVFVFGGCDSRGSLYMRSILLAAPKPCS